jgi:hypothetical protein
MFALLDMLHFFSNKFARLRAGCLALSRVLARPLDGPFFRHIASRL